MSSNPKFTAGGRLTWVACALGFTLLCVAATALHACGPDFPNTLLKDSDGAVLSAPVADFARELERLDLAPVRFVHMAATNGYEQQSLESELADLAAALKKSNVSPEESTQILSGHRANRQKLRSYLAAHAAWAAKSSVDADENTASKPGPRPAFPSFEEVPGMPGEFADYFAGAVALHNPDTNNAAPREAWERLLKRPAAERKYKSTWAAFMLGKSWERADDDKAVEYFQMTRDLAKQRFADSIGLEAAAIGLEGRVELRRKHFERAMKLYLEQYATGDGSAVVSLRWTAQRALEDGGEELIALAATANARAVVTAYLISGERQRDYAWSDSSPTNSVSAWLKAVEAADVKDVESAERLALAAYQAGEFDIAQRWVNRARSTPVAQWLQAKLLLRAGKTQPAAALLAKVVDLLSVVSANELTNSTEFADSLRMPVHGWDDESVRTHVLAELGVLRLSRREFAQALDALLRAGFWMDAAYVAERVLTTDELTDYVDRFWSATSAHARPDENHPQVVPSETADTVSVEQTNPELPGKKIRYLLARRLTREMHGDRARQYYPAEWQPKFDELARALRAGWDENQPADQRARWLFGAAMIARTNGMELLGTEVGPDWRIWNGSYDWGITWLERASNAPVSRINKAGAEEIRRASQPTADPDQRFHYRYQAAFLAWEAAKLMPDNSDDTARVLCTAGSWLKYRNPETADIFYKALVRRCLKTELGAEADRRRWFPTLDENGKIVPSKKKAPADAEATPTAEAVEINETGPTERVK